MIKAHGGELVNRTAVKEKKSDLVEKAKSLKKIIVDERQSSDIEMIASGAFSPLKGFMGKKDYESVLDTMHLSAGNAWSLPICLAVGEESSAALKLGDEALLRNENNGLSAVIKINDIYEPDKKREARSVFKTDEAQHPGVKVLYEQGGFYLGGEITVIELPKYREFNQYRIAPTATRELFEKNSLNRVVGFQTRNPIHRAHEYIIKCALEITDAVMIHPIVGATKSDDVPPEIRMKCYEVLINGYFPKDRAFLVVNPAYMRYAGPREAIFHALIRKNYGCTHFIVGRDHAGVGNYYGPYDAQKIFSEFEHKELGIMPLFFENSFWCNKCEEMSSVKTCPHGDEQRLNLSGTKVREMLRNREIPPAEFTREEIAKILIEWINKK